METNQIAPPPPSSGNATPAPKKTGLGTGAKVGIGCGVLVLLAIIAIVAGGVMMGGKLKKFAEDAQNNPTRATADLMVTASGGTVKLVAEDEVNKRYTVKDGSGNLTTIYWDESKGKAEVISGDFSAIPSANATVEPDTAVPESGSGQ